MADRDGAVVLCSRSDTMVCDLIAQGAFSRALEELIQQYQDAIVSYCRCHLLDLHIAEEIAQDVFLAAFIGMPRFRGQSSVKTWLYRIAVKKCLAAGRNQARREALMGKSQRRIVQEAHGNPPVLPEERLEQESQRRLVWQALRRLRGYERTLIVLRYRDGLTYSEIASVLQVSTRTVERHLLRAQTQFQTAYERGVKHVLSQRQPQVVGRALPGVAGRF